MFTNEQLREYRKNNYVSDTSVRDAKINEVLGKLLTTLSYTAKLDAGRHFEIKMMNDTELNVLLYDGWSEALVVNLENLAATIDTSKMTVSRYMTKAQEKGYLVEIGTLRLDGAKFNSNVYMVNVPEIEKDFNDIWKNNYQDLGNKYYHNIEVREKSKIALNNKCMTQPIWQDLKTMIDEANNDIPDKFKIKFMDLDENGEYINSRYYSILCNSLNPERHSESDRYELLRERFNTDANFVEIDVNSMMLRTSYNLIHEDLLPIDTDVYYELYKKMTANPMSIEVFRNEARQYIKSNVMPIYMDPRSVYCKLNSNNTVELNKVKNDYEEQTLQRIFNMSKEEFLNRLKEAMYQFLSVYDFDGDKRVFFGSMFFKYEAIVYYYMNNEFKNMGIASANVYDGFYFIEGTCDKELFYKVYDLAIQKTKEFLAKYNHDLVAIYGKEFRLKYVVYKKVAPKYSSRRNVTYDIPNTENKPQEPTEQTKLIQQALKDPKLAKDLVASGKLIAF